MNLRTLRLPSPHGALESFLGALLIGLFVFPDAAPAQPDRPQSPTEKAEEAEDEKTGTEEDPEAARPNVLFIAVDDLNDWVASLGGHPHARTPAIDRLAARGVLFERAYCSAPACNPSRASLLAGLRPTTTGVYHNNQPWRPAMPDAVTLPRRFLDAGYSVAGGGKIFHGGQNDPASWEEYFPQPRDPLPGGRPLSGIPRTAHFDWGPVDVEDEAMGDHKVVDWAIEYLARPHAKPFFLAVGIYRPHLPWYVPPCHFEPFPPEEVALPKVQGDDLEDVPEAGRRMARMRDHRRVTESGNWHRAVSGYLASMAFADAMVGRLLEALDAGPHARNTVIVLWGDHGWHLGEKKHWRKFALWEEATRVPLIIVRPGMESAGRRCRRTVSLLDLYPTLVELAGIEAPPELEGRSLVSLLDDPETSWDRPVLTTHGRGNHAVRDERWRYIRYADGSEELYDHERDPMEWRNLAAQPEHAALKRRLAEWIPETEAEPAPRRKTARRKRASSSGTSP